MQRCTGAVIGEGSVFVAAVMILLDAGHDIRAVFTRDRSAVRELEPLGIAVHDLRADLVATLEASPVDWVFSVVNPRILTPRELAIPRVGTVNYHDSPLPRYAGMHATTWALINGEERHAVSWHLVTPELDAGDLVAQVEVAIAPDDTAHTLNLRCAAAALTAFAQLVHAIGEGRLERRAQDLAQRTYYGKHLRPAGAALLHPHRPARELDRLVRALAFGSARNPLGRAKLCWAGQVLAVGSAQPCAASGAAPGTIVDVDGDAGRLRIATGDADVWLGGLATLAGEPLPVGELAARWARAPRVEEPEREACDAITALDSVASRHEAWWVRRLSQLEPPNLAWAAIGEPGAQPIDALDEALPAEAARVLAAPDAGAQVLAAVGIVLARLGGAAQVDLAWAAALDDGLARQIFAAFVPVRVDVAGAPDLAEVRRRAADAVDQTRARGLYAQDVVSRHPELRSLAGDPPLPVAVSIVSMGAPGAHAPGSVVTLQLLDAGRRWRWTFDPTRIEGAQVRSLAAAVLRALLASPALPVHAVPLVSDAEREQSLVAWNSRLAAPAQTVPVHLAVAAQAQRTPDALAVTDGRVAYTYRELDDRANRIARWLVKRGAGEERCVAVWTERSADWIALVVGIAKSGGAYLPIEPGDPLARAQTLIADARPALLLVTGSRARGGELDAPCVELDDAAVLAELASESAAPIEQAGREDSLVYVIYTSGTTGVPNGVAVEHRQLAAFVAEHVRNVALTAADRVSQMSSPAFDAGMSEIWPTLTVGASLHLVADDLRLSLPDLARWMSATGITLAGMPTHLAEAALAHAWDGRAPRLVTTGGASLHRRPASTTPFGLVNSYGPTETTVYVTTEHAEPGAQRGVSIGTPIGGTQVYVVGPDGSALPVGMFGELWVGGANVARGYLGKPALTAERFLPNPFGAGRVYRTGDRVRWTADGRLEFGGRIDHQVKLRGFRIELGEIEAALAASAGVREAVVVVRGDEAADQRLVAYVVPAHGHALDALLLKAAVRDKLPAYMVPGSIVILPELPRTAGGKIDRKALPAPQPGSAASPAGNVVGPRSATEHVVAEVFQAVFRLEQVGIDDDFHDLGGHSLLAMAIVNRVRDRLAVDLALIDVMESPTVAKLSEWIDQLRASGEAIVSDRPMLQATDAQSAPLTAPQRGTFYLDRDAPTNTLNRATWSVRLDGAIDPGALERALWVLRDRHTILRSRFVEVDGTARQEILASAALPPAVLERIDLSGLEGTARDRADHELHQQLAARPLALGAGETFRAVLVAHAPMRHRLTLWFHRIACDAESVLVLLGELGQLWRAYSGDPTAPPFGGAEARGQAASLEPTAPPFGGAEARGQAASGDPMLDVAAILPAPGLQYVDLAVYLERLAASGVGAAHRAYWLDQLAGLPPLEVPHDLPREPVDAAREAKAGFVTFPIGTVAAEIEAPLLSSVGELARALDTTVHTTLLAAMAASLRSSSGQRELALLSHLSYRHLPGLERAIGLFANPLVIRISAPATPTVRELVARAQHAVTRGYEHGEHDVLSLASPHVFRFWFNYISSAQREGAGALVLPAGVQAEPVAVPGHAEAIAYDLMLLVGNRGDRATLTLAYSRALFTPERAHEILHGYLARLAAWCRDPDALA